MARLVEDLVPEPGIAHEARLPALPRRIARFRPAGRSSRRRRAGRATAAPRRTRAGRSAPRHRAAPRRAKRSSCARRAGRRDRPRSRADRWTDPVDRDPRRGACAAGSPASGARSGSGCFPPAARGLRPRARRRRRPACARARTSPPRARPCYVRPANTGSSGRSARTCSSTIERSSRYSSKRSTWQRRPADRPCPRWS